MTRPVATESEYVALSEKAKEIKRFRKEIDEYTKPLRKATKAAHAVACKMFSDFDDPLEAMEDRVKPLLMDWENRQEAIRLEQEKKLNESIAALPMPEGVPALVVTVPKMTSPEGLSRRHTWSAKITDLKALARAVADGVVPEAYIQPNYSVLNMQAKALKKEMKIPGVVSFEEADLAIRAG